VPDTSNVTGEAMKEDGTVNRGALPAIFNPEDLNALEAALKLRDEYGGSVTAITMGPPSACEVLRECLYRGADRVILLTDVRAAASDTLATSYILSQAIKKIGKYDFVFCGRQAIDGDTAQVGPQTAEKLGIPQITYFEKFIDISKDKVRARRNVGNGWEVLETKIPVLLTALDTTNEPRPAAARRVMLCKRARSPVEIAKEVDANQDKRIDELKKKNLLIEQWDLDDIEADLQWCGMSGSPTKVNRVQAIVLKKEGYKEVEPTEAGIKEMIHELVVDRTWG
jgi:electron transfer flavoprotein beta subunit